MQGASLWAAMMQVQSRSRGRAVADDVVVLNKRRNPPPQPPAGAQPAA